jgi:hypothetical protein
MADSSTYCRREYSKQLVSNIRTFWIPVEIQNRPEFRIVAFNFPQIDMSGEQHARDFRPMRALLLSEVIVWAMISGRGA